MKRRPENQNISFKVSRVLHIILIFLLLIVGRIWQLAVLQHDEKVTASQKPQRRVQIEKADRATISDRFGTLLALNKIHYAVSVSYGGIREVPRTLWKTGPDGEKIKVFKRKEYIEELASLLSAELDLNRERLEDLIHSKAAIFGNVPFLIKEDISEETYFRLKMREKDFPGLIVEKNSVRTYPQGAVASEVIGYLGAISRPEYHKVTEEMQALRHYLTAVEEGMEAELPRGYVNADMVSRRLQELERLAYTINDKVGKEGVERTYDENLRGAAGAKIYLADTRGNYLQELEGGYEKKPGQHLTLTLSMELQEYAEMLLAEYENTVPVGTAYPYKQPWIKGGAIVALNPTNGEIYALASSPRFEPNDFIARNDEVSKWLENESFLHAVWLQNRPLFRERYDSKKKSYYQEELFVTWDTYLTLILPSSSALLKKMKTLTVGDAYHLQNEATGLFSLFKPSLSASKIIDAVWKEETQIGIKPTMPEKEVLTRTLETCGDAIQEYKTLFATYFSTLRNDEKLLCLDLCRLAVLPSSFSTDLLECLSGQSLDEFRSNAAALERAKECLKEQVKALFQEIAFKPWREQNEKTFLAQKRKEEMKKRRSGKPYIEYLDEKQNELFGVFWKQHEGDFLEFFLTGKTRIKAIFPYAKALHFDFADEKMKALTAFAGALDLSVLRGYVAALKPPDLENPLWGSYGLTKDKASRLRELAYAFYPRYGYGFTRSQAFQREAAIGSVFKLIPAYEALRQKYLQGEREELNPLVIIDEKKKVGNEWVVGYTLDHKPLQRYWKGGLLPRSDHAGVGQVDLVKALAASSNPYFAILAGEHLEDPEDLCRAAALFSFGEKTGVDLPGEIRGNIPKDVAYNRTGLYSLSIGQHSLFGTPLQIAVMLSTLANGGHVVQPKIVLKEGEAFTPTTIRREVFLPSAIRDLLLKGMKQVIFSEKGTARGLRQHFPEELLKQLAGKTSTAEVIEKVSLDSATGKVKCKHISFGVIHFEDGNTSKPDLVVVAYFRFGEYGNVAAPYAVKMIQKWQEICSLAK